MEIKYSRGKNPNSRKNSPFVKGHKVYVGSEKGQFKKGSKGHLGYKHPDSAKIIMRMKKLKETTPLKLQVRNSVKYKEWMNRVFERDNWTCQTCRKRGNLINAHHIILYSKLFEDNNIKTFDEAMSCTELWDINNGVTLCEECHDIIHKNKKQGAD